MGDAIAWKTSDAVALESIEVVILVFSNISSGRYLGHEQEASGLERRLTLGRVRRDHARMTDQQADAWFESHAHFEIGEQLGITNFDFAVLRWALFLLRDVDPDAPNRSLHLDDGRGPGLWVRRSREWDERGHEQR